MAYEHRPNTGSVFKNEKATTPQHPGYTGSAIIGEVEYRVSIWVKNADDPNRKTFLSMKFEPADEWKKTIFENRQRRSRRRSGRRDSILGRG